MKICIVTHTMPRFKKDTNSASFISELAKSLADAKQDIHVLTPYDRSFKKEGRGFKITLYKYIWPDSFHLAGYSRVLKNKKLPFSMAMLSALMSVSALINLVILSREKKFDIVSAHWLIPNGFIAYLNYLMTGIPYTVTMPGSDVYLGTKNFIFKWALMLSVSKASVVISDSQHYLTELSKLSITPQKASVVRYGVDTKVLKPETKNIQLLEKYGILKNDQVVMTLGRFVEKKGYIYAIRSMKSTIKAFPKAKLLMLGDGELRGQFENEITKLGLQKKVIIGGAIPYSERCKHYNLADVFLMPSIKDSSGNIDASPVAMMDAMSCGIPVVATKYSGDASIVVSKVSGEIVSEKSSNQIAEAVIKVLRYNDKALVRKRTRKIAVNNFSLRSVAAKYIKVFRQSLKS